MERIFVTNRNGYRLNFYVAALYMDDDIVISLSDSISPCSEQEFFSAYETAHEEKFGEEWELSKVNPCF